jgi:hypothetical protein
MSLGNDNRNNRVAISAQKDAGELFQDAYDLCV